MAAPRKKTAEVKEEPKVEVEQPKKYRHEFKSWKEYNDYKGPKG